MEQLEKEILAVVEEQKKFIARADAEFKTSGTMHAETKEALDKIIAQREKMQTQLDALDAQIAKRHRTDNPVRVKSFGEQVTEQKHYLDQFVGGEFRPTGGHTRINLESSAFPHVMQKTVITGTGLGSGTPGILMPTFFGGPLVIAKQELRLRNIIPATPLTSGTAYFFVRQSSRTNAASPQQEGNTKAESTYAWDTITDTVKTLAHFTNVSRQALDDIPWLRTQIDGELTYGLLLKEEQEILAGSGTGQHLNGIITQATAYDTSFNIAGDTKLDKLRHAKLQARLAGLATFAPSAFVLHPTDMEKIELIKVDQSGANTGKYIVGDPVAGPGPKLLWGLPVVESDSITVGTFLVGAFDTAAEIVDRMAATLDISYEHNVNFTSNLATILMEERVGLAVRRPTAFITGSY